MAPMEKTVAEIIAQLCLQVKLGEADYGTPLKELGVDSLDVASIFLEIHERLGVRVPDQQIDGLDTVRRIAAYLEEKR